MRKHRSRSAGTLPAKRCSSGKAGLERKRRERSAAGTAANGASADEPAFSVCACQRLATETVALRSVLSNFLPAVPPASTVDQLCL